MNVTLFSSSALARACHRHRERTHGRSDRVRDRLHESPQRQHLLQVAVGMLGDHGVECRVVELAAGVGEHAEQDGHPERLDGDRRDEQGRPHEV